MANETTSRRKKQKAIGQKRVYLAHTGEPNDIVSGAKTQACEHNLAEQRNAIADERMIAVPRASSNVSFIEREIERE